jgi:FdhE protein
MGRGETEVKNLWEKRRARAEALLERWPFAEEILRFLLEVIEVQAEVCRGAPAEAMVERIRQCAPAALPEAAARACVALARRAGTEVRRLEGDGASGRCPACGGAPAVGILREDRDDQAVARWLVCGGCAAEWRFARVLCPSCGEESPGKLPRLTAQQIPWIRVEACDGCGRYLKSVDLTLEPSAEPWVDELASLPLDLVARERGYVKAAPNLAGF